jgi:malonyl-CoA/methylmalonyl-CoA synthetase
MTEAAWHVHRRPGSTLALDTEQCRRELRAGNVRDAVLAHADAELVARVERVAGGLAAHGVERGSVVSLGAPNSPDWVAAYLAVLHLGAILHPFNPTYTAEEVAYVLGDATPAFVIREGEELPEGPPVAPASVGADDPALLIYTSGTTGRPKGALLDHGNLLAQARGCIEAWRISPDDRLVHALPLFHLHGLAIGFNATMIAGASLELIPFSPEGVVAGLRAGGTMFFGVPAMYQRLVEHLGPSPASAAQREGLSHVRLYVSGSAPLPPALFGRAAEVLGQEVLERYGTTEGGIAVSNPYDGPRQAGRVGYPLPGVELRLGEESEVQLRGGQVFSGYWRNDAATREAFTADGWLRTGDAGEIGADGSLAIRGRLKEMIITGGLNVYPREVELVLEQHPAVAEVAVVGRQSERWGEEVTACVVAREGVSAEELVAYARGRLAPYKCPRAVVFVAELPRNAMGKVQRQLLVG